jgi:hypothetical protein
MTGFELYKFSIFGPDLCTNGILGRSFILKLFCSFTLFLAT